MINDRPVQNVSNRMANKRNGVRPARVKRKQLEKAIKNHVTSQHCTLYGQAFDVGPEGSLDNAVRFFADFFEEINAGLR